MNQTTHQGTRSAPATGNRRPLGKHAKSAAGADAKRVSGTVHDPALARRWKLQRKAQQVLADKKARIDRYGEERAAYVYRVAMCHRGTDGGPVEIRRSPDGHRARFDGLQTCGSVWHCPVCAPKVAATRRDEMNLAIHRWINGKTADGGAGHVYFITYTNQHTAEDAGAGDLQGRRRAFGDALSQFKGSRAYRDIMGAVGAVGSIRGLETTYGEINGWHVHTHELLFAAPGALVYARGSDQTVYWLSLLGKLRRGWARVLIARGMAGLEPSDTGAAKVKKLRALLRHCLTVQSGAYAAEYVAKFGREPEGERGSWGLASELTASHLKRGRAAADGLPQRCSHASPWALLNDALDGDTRSGELFREFAVAFHGSRQLFWSRGLKAYFGIAEASDDELAAAPERKCSEYVVQLTPGQWETVIAHDARFNVLRAAATGGRAAVLDLLEALSRAPPKYSGAFTETRAIFIPARRAA